MERIGRRLDWEDLVIVRLLRRWVAAQEAKENPLPSLVELARELKQPAQVAVALHSLFQLTESCLGRRIKAECCCSGDIGPDERAILLMVAAAPAPRSSLVSRDIPHGLPGALSWAATSVRRVLGRTGWLDHGLSTSRCPFHRG